ncbi:MAG: hypothetical protein HOW97_08960 [Catenulispora sp.]|nr:hypothetical protein [Catenulispora sp.]
MPTIVAPVSAVSPADPQTPAWVSAANAATIPPAAPAEQEPAAPANPWDDEPQPPAIAGLPPGFTPIGEEAKKLSDTAESTLEPVAEPAPDPDSAVADVEAVFGKPHPASDAAPAQPSDFDSFSAGRADAEPASEALADVDAAFGPPKPAADVPGVPSIAPPTFATELKIPTVGATDAEPEDKPAAPIGIPSIAPPTFATEFNIPVVTSADSTSESEPSSDSTPAQTSEPAPSASSSAIPSIAPPVFATDFHLPVITSTGSDDAGTADSDLDETARTSSAASSAPAIDIPSIAPPTFATEFNIPVIPPTGSEASDDADTADSDLDETGRTSSAASSAPAIGIPSIAPPTFATEFNIPAVTPGNPDADADLNDTAPSSRPPIDIPQIAEPAFATGFGFPDPLSPPDPPAADQLVADVPPPGDRDRDTDRDPNPDLDATARTDTAAQDAPAAAWSASPPVTPDAPTITTPILRQTDAAPPASPVHHAPPIPPHLQQPMTPPKSFTAPAGASAYQPPPASQPSPSQPPSSAPYQPPTASQAPPMPPAPPLSSAPSAHPAHPAHFAQPGLSFPAQPQHQQPPPPPQQQTPPSHMTVVPLPPSMQSPYGAPDRSYPAGPKPTLHDTDGPGWSRNKRIAVIAGAAAVVVAGIGGTIFALSGSGDSPKPAPSTASVPPPPDSSTNGTSTPAPPTSQPSTAPAPAGPIGAAQGEEGAKDVVLRGLYAAAADRDFKTVCTSQTLAAQKGAAKRAGWNNTGDPLPLCEKYFTDNWSAIPADYLRGRKVIATKQGANANTMVITVDDAPPGGNATSRAFTVVWSNNHWLLDAAKA